MFFFISGGFQGMNLQGFDDAMLDAGTGLTHASLTGERKQSVGDAERMLSFLVAKFLREHGYIRKQNTLISLQVSTRSPSSKGPLL